MLKPIGNLVLIKPINEEPKTSSGKLYLPDQNREERKGQVVALGDGKLLPNGTIVNFNVKVGDVVYFQAYVPNKITHDGEEYFLLSEDTILAIIQ